jgi:transposase
LRLIFPNAQVIIDRFHIVQMLNRSFNQLRVQTMRQFKHTDRRYILLKYYWKSYLKSYNQLEVKQVKYYQHLKDRLTQEQIVEEGLSINSSLRATYDLMQDLDTHYLRIILSKWLDYLTVQTT